MYMCKQQDKLAWKNGMGAINFRRSCRLQGSLVCVSNWKVQGMCLKHLEKSRCVYFLPNEFNCLSVYV